jgi:putative holliday junction resolvase
MKEENKKFLGIDWGDARIGLALGDSETKMASPFKTVRNLDEVIKTVKAERVEMIVVGKPIKMSGQTDKLTAEFEVFAENLEKATGVPIKYIDERLTSKAADALPGSKKTKAGRDEIAAMIILQSFFDKEQKEHEE